MRCCFVHIAVDTPLDIFFDYRWLGEKDAALPVPGQLALVPLGKREVIGLIVTVSEQTDVPEDKLRDVIAKAKSNNMPNDNISRSIKKAAGELGSVEYAEINYEGYAPGGVAVIVECISDNRNRTASDIRHCFAKNEGTLGVTGSVSFMFDKKGVLVVARSADMDEDEMMMRALDAGAEDMQVLDDAFEITTDPNEFSAVREKLEADGLEFLSAEVQMIPQNTVAPTPENIEKIQELLEMLEDNDDVQNVWHNAELPEEPEEE
ncbi:MAG TPA: YebC/PmpR family DNA-binding transcriptional regulator [Candidatus Limiplasma sp.]|nr:YebC/PmpR family DNA-binding transcriptional regulator [Candidatus Limiplasma sp.]